MMTGGTPYFRKPPFLKNHHFQGQSPLVAIGYWYHGTHVGNAKLLTGARFEGLAMGWGMDFSIGCL